jgi:CelD/BcsL family acetyltransferase involved in cellulose biosynthesis
MTVDTLTITHRPVEDYARVCEQLRLIPYGSLSDARRPWEALAGATANIFSTWDWSDVWWRHFGRGTSLRLGEMRLGRRTLALLPMHEQRRRGVRLLRFLGHGLADQLGPVCEPSELSAVAVGLTQLMSDGSLLLAERMPADSPLIEKLTARLLSWEANPVIDLQREGGWDSYLRARSSNFRQQVRRRERRLTRQLGVTFRLTEDPGRLQADLDTVIALHGARWGTQSAAFEGAREAFHREFAARALERGWLRLWIAEAGGTPVAAWYGFRFGGVESYYQLGRDPNWDRYGVGVGILEHSIRAAFDDGMREYRLLRGGEQYKHRYATRDAGLCTVAAASRPAGRAAVSAISLLARRERGRRLLKASEQSR